jgi:ribonuclease R
MSTDTRSKRIKDPMAEREARKYEHPVPSREAVLTCLAECGELLTFDELTASLGVSGERDLEAFSRRLRAMQRDGQIHRNRRGRFGLISQMDMVRGRISGHPDGFGFLIPEQGGEDLFLSPREMRQVLHGDRVVGVVTGIDARGRKQGRIVEVLERQHNSVVGRYVVEPHMSIVVTDDRRISQDVFVPASERGAATHGQIVVCELIAQPTASTGPVGRVVEVLGEHMAPGMETEIAIRKYELPHEWPRAVLDEAGELPGQVPEADKSGRVDLRGLPLVTIDGEDARDFDDAVYCERRGKGWRLIVAIADVSHYVRPGSDLDREAYLRGNSVYFPNRVIPMLPEALSNGLCSLNPKVDRLCMTCDMSITPAGKIKDYKFYSAVMRSQARLTYNEVAAMLVDNDASLLTRHEPLVPHLRELYALFEALRKGRFARGAVDLDLPETRVVFDQAQKIERIVPLVRNDAHRLIEECMLAANVCAAELFAEHEVPSLYRIHETPPVEKLNDLRSFLSELGLSLGGGDEPKAKDYGRLIEQVRDRPDVGIIQTVLLRSLSQAIYSPDNVGHFALGYVNYTHFTSPIRRYPDLLVHRAIKRITAGEPVVDGQLAGELERQGEHCSMSERRADEATRDVMSWLKAEFMMDRVGEVFEGTISGVTSFGIFVTLKDVYVEGLVHITALGNDYFHFDAAHHRLSGERTGSSYRLGDSLQVRLVRVDLDEARLDFDLAAQGPSGPRRTPKRKRKKSVGGKKARPAASTRRKSRKRG